MLILTTFLSSCATTPQVISYKEEPIEKPALVLPATGTLELRDADWDIITPDALGQVFDKLQADGEPVVIYALTTEGYEQLSLNMADIIKLLSQQKAIIEAYKEYYEKTEKNIDDHNSKNKEVPVEKTGILDKFLN